MILAGGRGSRLAPYTTVIPKPLVPVGEMPILEILVRQLKFHGFDQLTLSVGYLAPLIEAYCGDGSQWGVRLDYLRETSPLGTAGCLGLVRDLEEDRLLVVNGDTLTDLDMAALYREHDPHDGATVCSKQRTLTVDFGVLDADDSGRLRSYAEKPELSYEVSIGVNVVSAWAIDTLLARHERVDMPDFLRRILAADRDVRIHRTDAFWLDIGRLADLDDATQAVMAEPDRFVP